MVDNGDSELASGPDVVQGILRLASASAVSRGYADGHRVGAKSVKKTERRQVAVAGGIDRAHKRNRAGSNGANEEPVALFQRQLGGGEFLKCHARFPL